MYGNLPFYPGHCSREKACMSVPLFEPRRRPPKPDLCCDLLPKHRHDGPPACCAPKPCRPDCGFRPEPPVSVQLKNPWNPCEQVTVALSVDECGNLLVCIRRLEDVLYSR